MGCFVWPHCIMHLQMRLWQLNDELQKCPLCRNMSATRRTKCCHQAKGKKALDPYRHQNVTCWTADRWATPVSPKNHHSMFVFSRPYLNNGRTIGMAVVSVSVCPTSSSSVCHGCIVAKRCEIGSRLLLITIKKSHIGFHMTWKSMTLGDPERW